MDFWGKSDQKIFRKKFLSKPFFQKKKIFRMKISFNVMESLSNEMELVSHIMELVSAYDKQKWLFPKAIITILYS